MNNKSSVSNNPYNPTRDALFGGSINNGGGASSGGRGGRTWGAPRETPMTENLDNRQLLDMQKNTMAEQDAVLDILSDSIGRQKEIALEIGKEADEQNMLLDELDVKVSRTDAGIRNATRRVVKVATSSSTGIMWTVICVLILALVVLSFLAIYL